MEGLIIIISIIVLVAGIYAAFQFGEVVEMKGYPEKKTMVIILCICFPIAGYILPCALPNQNEKQVNNYSGSYNRDDLPEL